MTMTRLLVAILFLLLTCTPIVMGQETKTPDTLPSPPHLLLLVHQEIQYGKATARRKLAVSTARACNRLQVPNFWIDMESLTGPREVLFFDPFDSYEHLEQSFADWNQIYAAHPDLAKMQEEIDALLTSERTIVAERRDDLGYRMDNIDLLEARFMRVVEVRLSPGHELDFVEALKILRDAYVETKNETPWVVYQMRMGMQSPGFIIFVPLATLKQNEDLIPWTEGFLDLEGEEGALNLEQIARDAFMTSENNLFAISTEMSHLPKKSAAGGPLVGQPGQLPDARPAQRNTSLRTPVAGVTSKASAGSAMEKGVK
jgi:hypothetical protein